MSSKLSPVRLGILWQRLTGLMDEVAHTFVRTSFSVVVRENWDLTCSFLDAEGRQFAQSSRSIPSFIGTMPRTLAGILRRIPKESLRPGDVLISNDPWLGTGHLNDISMFQPVFRHGTLIGYLGGTFHTVDIGGAPSPNARDSFEEGLCIPIARIKREGVENEDIINLIRENVREPEETLGDIRAQFAAYDIAARRLLKMLDEEGIDDLAEITNEILDRSEASMRQMIAAIPDGEFSDQVTADGFETPLNINCTIRKAGSTLEVDYTGTHAQIDRPVNSVMNFTFAYSVYALKCALDPTSPNNDGALRPITITAPEGCLLNPRRPAPVWGRHLSGHYLPFVIYRALSQVIPGKIAAESGSPLWNVYFRGTGRGGDKFVRMFFMNGGHGARATLDGPSCLSFPSNVASTPIEQFENTTPLLVTEKALIPDSGGAGRFRGGLGQRLSFRATGDAPVNVMFRHERVKFPAGGLLGGLAGACGRDMVNGKRVPAKTSEYLGRGDVVTFETPGGGGMYDPATRDPAALAEDLREGLVSEAAAVRDYGAAGQAALAALRPAAE
jgi:N-methylhydantoinase B